jgi:hypothetical protein
MNRQALECREHSAASSGVDVDTRNTSKPVLLKMAGDSSAGITGLAHVDTTLSLPEDVDVHPRAEMVIEPTIKGPTFCVGAAALTFLGVPTSSPQYAVLKVVTRQFGSECFRRKVLQASGGFADMGSTQPWWSPWSRALHSRPKPMRTTTEQAI